MIWLLLPLLWLFICYWAPVLAIIATEVQSLSEYEPEAFEIAQKHGALLLVGKNMQGRLGFSAWTWPLNVIVISKEVIESKDPRLLPFIFFHEIGHVALRHTRWRWWAVALGIWWLPAVRRRYALQEDEANEYAERVTGVKRELLRNVK